MFLSKSFSIIKLTCPGELEPQYLPDAITSLFKVSDSVAITNELKKKLKTVAARSRLLNRKRSAARYNDQIRRDFETIIVVCCVHNYYVSSAIIYRYFQKRDGIQESNLRNVYKHLLFTVRVYHPFEHHYVKQNSHKHCKCSHVIDILGFQTLADLRDKIICNADVGICKEVDVPSDQLEDYFGNAKVTNYPYFESLS